MNDFRMHSLRDYFGTITRAAVALISLSGFAATAYSDTPKFEDVAALRAEVISRLKTDNRIKDTTPDPADPARFTVTRARSTGKDLELQVDVTNLLGRIRDLPTSEAETEIQRFLRVIVLSDTENGFDASHLIANIRPREHLDPLKPKDASAGKQPVYEDLPGDVVILYQIDATEALASVTFSDVEGRSLAELRELALENINGQMQQVRQSEFLEGIFVFTIEGDEAISPALLLTDKFWALLGPQFPEGVLIAIPRRDAIFVFDKRLPNAIQIARALIDKVFKDEPDLLSEYVFERRDGKLLVVAEH
ncbi:hypothetical protein [Mesorhizobium sophorae]|uniref:hypothetical protein n=1 Tax=Mesorhizobium sophorae TaxID=1300294 RepID=UPI0011817762|nr:hypothetical protein [Mesorhizobium sophorae]